MFKKLSIVALVALFLSFFCIGLKSVQAETFSDLTVTGDAHFQYPIYVDGGKIQFGGGDLRIVDFNQGGSRIFNQGDLHMVTDDKLFFDFSNPSGSSMTEFASRVQVNDNLTAMFPIYAQGNEIVFNGSGVAVKTADGTPRIYRSSDTLRLMAPNMNLDVPGTVTVENDFTINGDLQVVGSQTYTGNTTFGGTITATGLASLNGGIAVDTNKFTVADTSGNTSIAGTLSVTGNSTFANDSWFEDYLYMQDGSGGDAVRWDYGIATASTLSLGLYDSGAGTTDVFLTIDNNGNISGDADLTVTGATGANLVATTGTLDLTSSAGNTTITATGATSDIILTAGDDMTLAVTGDYVNTVGGTYLNTVTGTYDIDATGALSLNSSAGAINIGNDAVAQAINIGTGAAARTITIGELTTLTEVQIDGLLVDINAGATGLTIDSAGAFSIDGADASNISLASAGDADDLTIAVTGATNSSLVLASSGTAADALTISTSAGGMDITVAGAAAGEDLDILSNSSINMTATEDAANAININANGGTSSTMLFKNLSGTGDNSVTIASTLGGTKFNNAADKSILIDGGTTDKTADAMVFDVDVNSASVDGIYMDVDVATALSAGEIVNGMNIDVDGNAGDDAGSYVNGLFVTSANTSVGETSGIKLSGAFDYFLNVAPTTNSNNLVNVAMAANPNNTKAMNINSAATTASGTVTGLSVDLTNLDANGQNVYNLWLESPTAGAGNEYGIYMNGTSWDYAIFSDDNIRFGSGQNQTLDVAQSATGSAGKTLTVASGAAGAPSAGAGLNGGDITISGGVGSAAVSGDTDGGNGGNIILTSGSGAAGSGTGENGESGDIYLDTSDYVVFGGTSSSVGDMKYDLLDGNWKRYVENPTTFNVAINAYDAVKFVDSGDAGYDNTKVGKQVIKEAGDGESHRFAGIEEGDGIAVGGTGWIIVYGVAGMDDSGIEGPTDGDANAAAGDGFVLDGTAGAIRKTAAATDESCGYFVEKNGASDVWIVFVRAM